MQARARHKAVPFDGIWRILDRITGVMKVIGAVCLMGMTFLTCADIAGRFFRHPIFGSVEIVGFMATLAVAMALPYAHHLKAHVGVEILVRHFSRKTQAAVDLCTAVLSLALFTLLTWRMGVYAWTMQESGEVSMNLELPEYLIIYATAFCLLVFTVTILRDILLNIAQLREK
jgi:TRAP-type C4-dicarboxylate transport system permease small subunit